MAKKTSEILAILKKMAMQAGESLFERAGLALEVLADAHWIVEVYEGDRGKAEDTLKTEYFPDLSMSGWFSKLLLLRKSFPDIGKWREHKFDLQMLWIEHQKRVKPPPGQLGKEPPERKSPVPWKDYEETKDKLDSVQYQLRREKDKVQSVEEQLRDARREIHALKCELAEARGRIATLERFAPQMAGV